MYEIIIENIINVYVCLTIFSIINQGSGLQIILYQKKLN